MTTVVGRVCLDMLRSRRSRREERIDSPELTFGIQDDARPEDEAVLADSVGAALLVVLDTLTPAERLAFVLHDLFAVSFDEIAPIVGRSTEATRRLVSRGRRRVRGAPVPAGQVATQRGVIDAFLEAARGGDLDALVALLDPGVVFRSDEAAVRAGAAAELRGAAGVAAAFSGRAQAARTALVDGEVGVVVARRGQLFVVLMIIVEDGRIVEIDAVGDAERLSGFDIAG